MLPTVKFRRRNSDSGSIGWRLRASHTTKAANRSAPAASGIQTRGSSHPLRGCSISP